MKPKDRIMQADDMFLKGVQQLFSVRTGDFVGYSNGEQIKPPVPGPEKKDRLQLQMELF